MVSLTAPIIRIPPIDDEKLNTLLQRMRAICRFKDGRYFIKDVDPRGVAFTWSPEPAEKVPDDLQVIKDLRTYHSYSYHGFFKPSLAECIAQIPEELLDQVVAFEIVDSPKTAADLNEEHRAVNAGFHVATTRLYAHS